MNELIQNVPDSIPLFLKKEIVSNIDSVESNPFLSFQFLPIDESKMFYDVDSFNFNQIYSNLISTSRLIIHQYSDYVFLILTILFLFSSVLLKNANYLSKNRLNIFSSKTTKSNTSPEQVTASGIWVTIYFVFQVIILYSLFFLKLILENNNLAIDTLQYLNTAILISGGIFIFICVKLLLYVFIGSILSVTNKKIELANNYLYIIYSIGVLSFLPVFLFLYIEEIRLIAIITVVLIFTLGRIISFIMSYRFFTKSYIGFFYYIVYLCALEIMPYFLVYKAVILNIS